MTIVANPGALNANCYCTLAEANDYHSTRGFNDEWSAASDPDKEACLIWASRLLDEEDWNGSKNTSGQSMRWPRGGVFDRDGDTFDNTIIPKWLKNATAEFAFVLLKDDRTEDQGSLRAQVESMSGMSSSNVQHVVVPDSVRRMIAPFVEPKFRIRRA